MTRLVGFVAAFLMIAQALCAQMVAQEDHIYEFTETERTERKDALATFIRTLPAGEVNEQFAHDIESGVVTVAFGYPEPLPIHYAFGRNLNRAVLLVNESWVSELSGIRKQNGGHYAEAAFWTAFGASLHAQRNTDRVTGLDLSGVRDPDKDLCMSIWHLHLEAAKHACAAWPSGRLRSSDPALNERNDQLTYLCLLAGNDTGFKSVLSTMQRNKAWMRAQLLEECHSVWLTARLE